MGSIDEVDFWKACVDLYSRAERLNLEVEIFEHEDLKFLRITKSLNFKDLDVTHDDQVPEETAYAIEEIEDNVVYPPAIQPGIRVEYDLSYSPSYQVPVLYFRVIYDGLVKNKLDFIYDHLVPQSRSNGLQTVGILGAISQTNHPGLDIPCFFIHPCKTSEAMGILIEGRQISAGEYLQVWIGLIGSAVGLNLPIELAMDSK